MKNSNRKTSLTTADFLGTFQSRIKRARTKSRIRIKHLLKEAVTVRDKESLEEIQQRLTN